MSPESSPPLPTPVDPKSPNDVISLSGSEAAILEERITQVLTANIGPVESPMQEAVAKKLTGGHIEKFLELMSLREKNRHTESIERHKNRPYLAAGLIIFVLVFVLLLTWIALAYGKSEIVIPVLTGIVGLVSGAIWGVWIRAITAPCRAKPQPTAKSITRSCLTSTN